MIRPSRRARTLAALTLCVALVAPATARGQSEDPKARAMALYETATAELDAGKYESACPKLQAVTQALPDAMGAKLTLAECYEGLGKLASAWSQYTLVEAMAMTSGQEARANAARASAAALTPRLATLTIEVPAEVRSIPGLAITLDGLPVIEAQWGLAAPKDAGAYEVAATAPGRKAWKGQASVARDGEKVTLTVKAPDAEPSVKAPAAEPSVKAPAARPNADSAPRRPWQRPVGIAAMGLGGAGVVLGGVLGGLAVSKKGQSNADNHCDAADTCDPTGLALRQEAANFGNGSTAAALVGAALLAGGVVLFVTAPRADNQAPAEQKPASARKDPYGSIRIELTTGFVWVKGTW